MSKPIVHGAGLTPYGIYLLAESYRAAGDMLNSLHDRHSRFSDHPRRLLYFQALENYLRSFLRLHGTEPEELRRYNHDFAAMLNDSKAIGMHLSKDAELLVRSSALRGDYVRIRYDYNLSDPSGRRRKQPSMKSLEKAVFELENTVRSAIEATGIEVSPKPV